MPRSAKSDVLAALKTVADVAPDGLDERDLAERTGVYTSGKRLFRLANVALTARAAGDDKTGAAWARKLVKKYGRTIQSAPLAKQPKQVVPSVSPPVAQPEQRAAS